MAALGSRPLLGDTRRIWVVLALAACVIVVGLMGLLFQGQSAPDRFDDAVDAPTIAFFSGHDGVLRWLIRPGDLTPAIAISAVTAAGCLLARRLNGALLAVTVIPVAAGLDDGLLKHLFHRTYLGVLSFPSGHTTSVTGMTAAVAILLLVPPQQAKTRTARAALVATACLITAAVAVSVIGLRFHYFTDTVAGAAVGVGAALALALLLDLATGVINRPQGLHNDPALSPQQVSPVHHSPQSADSS